MALTIETMSGLFQEGYSIVDFLPYIEMQDDVIIGTDGSLGMIWKITPICVEGRSKDELLLSVAAVEQILR